jgi:amino acid adenylation domain-containing protein/non-ribosomal peptide synthase protein (TIGR01720 family)
MATQETPEVQHAGPPSLSATGSLPGGVSDLTPEQQALLMMLLRKRASKREAQSKRVADIEPAPEDGNLPLSFAQQRLWVIDQLAPGNSAYNLPVAIRLTGQLKAGALEQGISEIVRRHKVLRTTFETANGEARQVICAARPVELQVADLSGLSEAESEAGARRLARDESRRPFDLTRGPLLRATLLRLHDGRHAILFTMHHIVSDGWSMGVLIREFVALYDAYCAGSASPLTELGIQYVDFAAWQRQWLQGEALEAELAYWKKQLAGAPAVLALPADRPRKAVQRFRGAQEPVSLSPGLIEAFDTLGGQAGGTLFMTLLAAFKVLLHRYTSERDLIVGTIVANRTRSKIEGLIGFFVNMLVLRTRCSGDMRFDEFLERVREVTLEAYTHQEAPFDRLVDELQPDRHLSHAPLFQVAFNLHNQPVSALELPGLKVDFLDVGSRELEDATARYDLALSLTEAGHGLEGVLEYNSDLFDSATIKRLKQQFYTLLEAILADPKRRVSELPLLSPSERHHLLTEFNSTETDFANGECFYRVFERQADNTPDRIAVSFGDQQLTYAELNQRANRLAHYLRRLGVGPESSVAIRAERSLEIVTGLMAVVKAGGAFVPIDPALPNERLAFMLENAGASVLLTQRRLAEGLPDHKAPIICLDTDWDSVATESDENLPDLVTIDNIAYIIYTSGSTGRPKGVLVGHRGICNLAEAQIRDFAVGPDSRVLQFASPSFDASVSEVCMALLAGATLCLANRDSLLPGPDLITLLSDHAITTVTLPPSVLANMPDEDLPALRTIITAGEVCSPSIVSRWAAGRRFLNAYGPTEATVCASMSLCDGGLDQSPPIGRAMANTRLYVLDARLQPTPLGVPGELYIAGVGLARGYLGRAGMTAEKFVPDAFGDVHGARMYATGDLVRYLPDGKIEFLGRIDNQVKIRGSRVEPAEIEAVLSRHPGVREAVVMAHEASPGDRRLVAYVVPLDSEQRDAHETADGGDATAAQDPSSISARSLRGYLNKRLPAYMIPSVFAIVDALPLSSNGKVDRAALSMPTEVGPELDAAFVAPRTVAEETLAGIWSKVLGVNRVGVYDNFFELGGDSILGIQIVARANQAGLQLTPNQLFQHQTIAELAESAGVVRAPVQVEHGMVTGPVPLIPIQRWLFEQNLPDPRHFNQAVLLEVRKKLDPTILERVVAHLLLHHDALRLRFINDESGWRQINAGSDADVPFVFTDLSSLPPGERVAALEAAASQLQTSLNLSEGPLLRVALFNMSADGPDRLLLVIHHLVVDGVSGRILLEDLQTGYEQLSSGRAIQLPAKTSSYQQWANRLTQYAQSDELQKEMSYWLAESNRQACPLPLDFPDGINIMESARFVTVELSAEETQSLLQQVPKAYRTQIIDVLLTAVARAFCEWTEGNSFIVDLEGHGRQELFNDLDLSRTVGWFTNVFPVWLDMGGISDLGEALKSVKEQLSAVPRRGMGYGLLRYLSEDAETVRKLRELPSAGVIFNYMGQVDQTLAETALFAQASESCGPTGNPRRKRNYLIEINGGVAGGQLRLHWRYSENMHRRATIERLADGFIQSLRGVIAHCLSPEAGGYTSSDFPLAALSQQELEQALAGVEHAGGIEDIYPLSPLQGGLLFHSIYAPDSGVYVTQMVCTLERVDVEAFKKSWQQVIDRHSIFRTAFVWKKLRKPLQVVCHDVKAPIEVEDLRGLSAEGQESKLQDYLREDRSRGFEISRPPLMRLMLFRVSDDDYKLVWTNHHVLLEGWSTVKVVEDAIKFYEANYHGREIVLERPRPYRDYIAWLQQQDPSAAESYWRRTLKGFLTPTSIDIEQKPQRLPGHEQAYEERELRLSDSISAALESLARKEHLTLNTLVLGAYALLLNRYSGRQDVVFGNIISSRPPGLAGIESMVGLFINTLPMRVQVSPELSLLDWLRRLQEKQLEMRQFEYTPLVDVQRWSDLPAGSPLFECTYCFENYPVNTSLKQQAALKITDLRFLEQQHYSLRLNVAPGTNIPLAIAYETSKFDDSTIMQLLDHLRSILEAIANNPEQRVGSLTLLTRKAGHQALAGRNDTKREYPREQCIHELFETQAELTPDAVAVTCEGRSVTYDQLNRRSNQLAHYLCSAGIGPSSLVGIFMHHCVEELVAILGTLKAGAAYVPMDPDHPQERISTVIDDAQVMVVVTQQSLAEALPVSWAQVVCVDSQWEEIEVQPECKAASGVTSEQTAYVIYTSGSTGKPKGVMIRHQSLVNYVWWAKGRYLRGEVMDFCLYTSLAFDLTVTSIYTPLISGGRVVVASKGASEGGLEQIMGSGEVEVLKLTPSHLRMIKERDNRASSVRRLIVGGEELEAGLAREVEESFGGEVEIYNEYGPTEATVGCMIERYRRSEHERGGVPIGGAIANAEVYVLDEWMNEVGEGVKGELYIGGEVIGEGYIGRGEVTAERYVANPNREGERMYRTGDVVRYGAGGAIEYLGRTDHQVKIRGYRIELGEIESELTRHPALRQAVVLIQKDESSDPRLMAYIVPVEMPGPSVESLRSFLQERLPSYMVPTNFIRLESMPLTPNGKVDRRALPDFDGIRPDLEASYASPRTRLERIIASVWQEVLGVDKVGINDNFFDLGGHSLLLIQANSELERLLSRELSPMDLFEYPTISSLAKFLDQQPEPETFEEDEQVQKLSKGHDRLNQRLKQRQQVL